MANCGIKQIDDLVAAKDGAVPLTPQNAEPPSLSVLRDLLNCYGGKLPDLRALPHPTFDKRLIQALHRFQKTQRIPFDPKNPSAGVDTLQRLTAKRSSADRVCGLASVTLLLDISPFTTAHRILTMTSAWESNSLFGKSNWNSDGAGLSFGIIQWAQSQNRLTEIFGAFKQKFGTLFASIFGPKADLMLKHVAGNQANLLKLSEVKKQFPLLSAKDQQKLVGRSKAPDFELTNDFWKPRVTQAARATEFQKIQVDLALTVYQSALTKVLAGAPRIKSERGVAFLVDLANQYGMRSKKTKHGALDYYDSAVTKVAADAPERDILQEIVKESMGLFKKRPNLAKGVQLRRDFFLQTDLLSDKDYQS